MTIENQPSPIINVTKPENTQKYFIRGEKPKQTAWLQTFKRILATANTRYAFLWLTGGIIFALFGKRAIQRHEKELMIKDIENYLENKNNK